MRVTTNVLKGKALRYNRVIFILLVLFFNSTAFCQVDAEFSASRTTGCSPLLVQFSDLSTNTPTEWLWDLGNGTVAAQQNPSGIYVTPGTYTVKLRVKNAGGEDSVIKTDYITVYAKPSVEFSAEPLSGCAPINVNFTDLSTAGSGTIQSWVWDFGDGISSTDQNTSHTYAKGGSYNVSLFIINSFGCQQSVVKTSYINPADSVHADFAYNYTNICNPPTNVTFTNASSSTLPLSYKWTFGDGKQSIQQNPLNTYLTSGTYNVKLVASNASGCSDSAIQTISIGSVQADFSLPSGICINEPVVMSDSSTPVAVGANWDFGDGTTGTGLSVNHTYTALGNYIVTYKASFGGCSSAVTKTIHVTSKPTAAFSSASVLTSCNPPLNVQFDNNSVSAVSYIWDFGDGTTSSLDAPQHTFSIAGSYTIQLIAISAGGCSDTVSKTAFVRINRPRISGISNFPFFGCAPATIPFKAVFTSPDPIAIYLWDFGDGTTSALPTPSHTYNNIGAYIVTVTLTTTSGCVASYTLPSAIVLSAKPTADFSAIPTNVCASDSIQFTDMSVVDVDRWIWNFGDGTSSSIQNPFHHYQDTGYFNVRLIADNNGCRDTLLRRSYVYVAPPIADYAVSLNCEDRYTRTFTDQSIGPVTWNWDFGDGIISTQQNPVHSYADTGLYSIKLIVTNGVCKDTLNSVTYVADENPLFSVSPVSSNYCKNNPIKFDAYNYNPANITGFKWNFGDNTSISLDPNNETVLHKFRQAGSYIVKLITQDVNGCYDTVANSVPVTILGPTSDFTNAPGNCADSVFRFNDQSFSDGSNALVKWIWNYGDGVTDTSFSAPFQHIYSDSGTYDVTLAVFDANGCGDTLVKPAAVIIGKPYADFTISDSIRCTASSVLFKDSAAGVSLTYSWDFGDGNGSLSASPNHFYANEGIYSVSLAVMDIFGCRDTIVKPALVTISNPIAQFTISDSVATCPPLPVQVTSSSQNYSNLSWTFGDGGSSTLDQPFHLYTVPGQYTLQVIAQGFGQCFDTAQRAIDLKGPYGSFQYTPVDGCFPVTVSFNAVATNTASYIWDFGDGTTKITLGNNTTYTYTTPGSYVPKLVLEDPSGCRVPIVSEDTVNISGVKPKFFFNALTGCDSSMVTFTDSSFIVAFDAITSYSWDFGDGTFSSLKSPVHYYKKPGAYIVTQTINSSAGCSGTYSLPLTITINKAPKIVISAVDSVCINSAVGFSAEDTASLTDPLVWSWDLGNGSQSGIQNFSYTYTVSGVYTVSVIATSANTACADTTIKPITIVGLPVLNAGTDTSICLNSFATLRPSGASSYVWNSSPTLSCSNCTNPLAAPTVTTTYFVTGANSFGCINSDSVTVNVVSPTQVAVLANNDTLCLGSFLQLQASGAETYNWMPPTGLSNTTISNPVASPSISTVYTVIGSDNLGCFSDTQYVSILVAPLPTFNITDTLVTISAGSVYPIASVGSPDVIAWSWSPAAGLSCSDCASPIAQPRANITYTGTASNIFGCTATDLITFEVLCNNSNVYIPNTFSPNGDGSNEQFYPMGKGLFNIKSMRIYNRWGVSVFEKWNFAANTASEGWNGTYQNTSQPSDVYIYVIDVICDNGTALSFKGNITLIR